MVWLREVGLGVLVVGVKEVELSCRLIGVGVNHCLVSGVLDKKRIITTRVGDSQRSGSAFMMCLMLVVCPTVACK